MKIAIHSSKHSFSERWIPYCERNEIPFKIVDCNSNDIIRQLDDCDALMWHHFQTNPQSILFAKQLLFALEQSGKKVFPDFRSNWHFNDKLGQKYLLESIGAPLVPTYVFYGKNQALKWAENVDYPKVFKLRGGAGSSNVHLVRSKYNAQHIIHKAFRGGFDNYNRWSSFKEVRRKYTLGDATLSDLLKGLGHTIIPPLYSKILGRELGYVYFQDFIGGCEFDIRVKVIDNRCWAFKRIVRKNDFRASGSNQLIFSTEGIPTGVVELAFSISRKLKVQCAAYDFLISHDNVPYLTELSYGFGYDEGENYGYWDTDLNWYSEKFNPFGWMVESVIKSLDE